MIIEFPNKVKVDIDNVPEDFDDQIRESFRIYTEGTNPKYIDADRLGYLDLCAERANNPKNISAYDFVCEMAEKRFKYDIEELGTIPNDEEFTCIEFMESCYEAGAERKRLHQSYSDKNHQDVDKLDRILCRVIRVVMEYQE